MFLRLFKHLLPRAKAWSITIDKYLRQFFEGLTGFQSDIKDYIDLIYLDIFPDTTRFISLWENQFGLQENGLSDADRRDRLAATWKAYGGQDPTYIQDTIQAAGFTNVYIHEWWTPGTEPAVDVVACATPRDPGAIVGLELLLNDETIVAPLYIAQFGGTNIQFGNAEADFGNYDVLEIKKPVPAIPTDPAKWPFFLYFGDSVFGTFANVPAAREQEFKTLLKQICPGQHWLGLMINYV